MDFGKLNRAQLEQLLMQAEADLTTAEKRAAELESEVKERADRRGELPELIADANDRLRELKEQRGHVLNGGDESPLLAQARRYDVLSRRQAIESELLSHEKEILSYDARRELLAAEASRGGITDVTRGKADLTTPLGTPPGKVWRYGLGFPFQVGPKTAGLFCNIRLEGTPYGDFEIGTDLIPFDDLAEIDASRAIAISRSTHGVDPKTRKPYVMAKYPVIGGFVPYGAKRADGSAYPFVGSGFGMCQVCPYPGNFAQPLPPDAKLHYSLELHQFSYDGNRFQATPPVRVESIQFPDAWQGYAPGLTWAIPGGDHLLFPMSCFKAGASRQEGVAGVARFRFDGTQWQPVGFVAVTDPSSRWFEPSLIRDVDGRLLFSARGGRRGSVADVRLWRSSDNGKTWKQVFYRQGARTGTPIVLNRASDGTPYLATSTALGTDRRILDIVPVNDKRTGLQERLVARDSHAEFGPPPGSDRWKVDHGVGAVVRLGDGRWHGILVYRVMDQGENYGKPPAPQTGCYVEEVVCRGTAHPSWKFDE